MIKDSSRRTSSWRIETQAEPRQLDARSLDVKALRLHKLVDKTIVGRRVYIESTKNQENTPARASQLRKLAAGALEQFKLEREKREEVELVLAELIQNAHRYSASGPLWLSMVQTIAEIKKQQMCIIDITVANRLDPVSRPVQYEDAIDPSDDTLPDVSVHGRGEGLMDALSIEHGRFKAGRTLGAYALVGCVLDSDNLVAVA